MLGRSPALLPVPARRGRRGGAARGRGVARRALGAATRSSARHPAALRARARPAAPRPRAAGRAPVDRVPAGRGQARRGRRRRASPPRSGRATPSSTSASACRRCSSGRRARAATTRTSTSSSLRCCARPRSTWPRRSSGAPEAPGVSRFGWIDGGIVGLYLLATMAAGLAVRRYVGRRRGLPARGPRDGRAPRHRVARRHRVRDRDLHVRGGERLPLRLRGGDAGDPAGGRDVPGGLDRLLREAAAGSRGDDAARALRAPLRRRHPPRLGCRDRAGRPPEHGRLPADGRRVPDDGRRPRWAGLRGCGRVLGLRAPPRADDDRAPADGRRLHDPGRHAVGARDRLPAVRRDERGPRGRVVPAAREGRLRGACRDGRGSLRRGRLQSAS